MILMVGRWRLAVWMLEYAEGSSAAHPKTRGGSGRHAALSGNPFSTVCPCWRQLDRDTVLNGML